MKLNKDKTRLIMDERGVTQSDLLDFLRLKGQAVSIDTIKGWFRKTAPKNPSDEKIHLIADFLCVDLTKIIEKQKELEPFTSPQIPLLEMRAGFGTEGTLDPEFKVERCIKLPQEFLGKVNAKYAKIIQCYGDSMMPEFNDGDYILVEMLGGRDYIKRPSIYLVCLGDVVYIKRIEFLPNNDINLISINPAYPAFTASSKGYGWEILGAVYGKISVKLGSGFQFSEQGIKGK
ncbi:MAG: S24 family peptidase [Campylobacter sp.]|uniref:S24 family peptidase n=1 Tax=Campylobacter sp. TaxID=205 RepID=UPI002A81ECBC|nr:S24 family peptidase [Campylobacter sp.]MCI7586435.1 hypothetical protein [Campylobacter sp.]MDY5115950.1 S24 family peptidase [Campylobacter sp.]